MIKSSRWIKERAFIARKCDDLVSDKGGTDAAVALREIAEALGIRQVVFRPLLIEGGLGVENGQFIIFAKCDKERVGEFDSSFRQGGRDLPARTRFTIAHEMIHTLFFSWKNGQPIPRVKGEHPRELEALENACDFGANRLLLPRNRIDFLVRKGNFLAADKLRQRAKKFAVSVDVLIRGLKSVGVWGNERGAAAIVTTSVVPKIGTIAVDNLSKDLFHDWKAGTELGSVLRSAELEIFGGQFQQVNHRLQCTFGSRLALQKCLIECHRLYDDKYLLTVRLLGEPEIQENSCRDR